jgi:hypothetical protein
MSPAGYRVARKFEGRRNEAIHLLNRLCGTAEKFNVRRSFSWILAAAISWLFVAAATADVDDTVEQIEDAIADPLLPEDIEPSTKRRFPPIRLLARQEIEWGDFGTDVVTFRSTVRAEMRFPIAKNFGGALSARFGVTNTDFSGSNGFLNTGRTSGDPWDELYDFSLRLRTRYIINDTWGLVFAGTMISRWEDGASFGDGQKQGGAVGVTYDLGDRLSLVAGVSVDSRIVGGGVKVNPFGAISYQINDVHSLKSHGLGLLLRSRWNEAITTYFYGTIRGRRWRLDDRNDGVVDKGSLRDRKVPIGVGVRWKFGDGWRLRADLAVIVYRQLKVTDDDDDKVDTKTADAPGVFGSLELQYRF